MTETQRDKWACWFGKKGEEIRNVESRMSQPSLLCVELYPHSHFAGVSLMGEATQSHLNLSCWNMFLDHSWSADSEAELEIHQVHHWISHTHTHAPSMHHEWLISADKYSVSKVSSQQHGYISKQRQTCGNCEGVKAVASTVWVIIRSICFYSNKWVCIHD